MAICNEIKVAIMAINETTIVKVKAMILNNCHFHYWGNDGKEMGQKVCCTSRNFVLLIKHVLLLLSLLSL